MLPIYFQLVNSSVILGGLSSNLELIITNFVLIISKYFYHKKSSYINFPSTLPNTCCRIEPKYPISIYEVFYVQLSLFPIGSLLLYPHCMVFSIICTVFRRSCTCIKMLWVDLINATFVKTHYIWHIRLYL